MTGGGRLLREDGLQRFGIRFRLPVEGHGIWTSINLINLRENILPTRERAHLLLDKGPNHAVRSIRLRRL